MGEATGITVVMSPDEYGNGDKTCTVTLMVDESPMFDADGPTFEYALLQLVHNLANVHFKRGVEAERETPDE